MSASKSASGRCPICRNPAVQTCAPFCSRGCKDRDLLNWLGESYAVPGPPADMSETPLDKA